LVTLLDWKNAEAESTAFASPNSLGVASCFLHYVSIANK
jgi:hypothetical protein